MGNYSFHTARRGLSPNTRTRLITVNGKKVRAHRHIMSQHLGRAQANEATPQVIAEKLFEVKG